jgi:hypothetical protein
MLLVVPPEELSPPESTRMSTFETPPKNACAAAATTPMPLRDLSVRVQGSGFRS